MASIRGIYGNSQVAGSIGSTTFSRNRAGAYIRARSVPVNPKSGGQVLIRQTMAFLSNYWVNTLTPAQRQAWDDYASGTPIPDRFGELVNVGGRQMFIRSESGRLFAGLPLFPDAPTTPGVATSPSMTLTGDTVSGIEGIITNPVLATGDLVFVRISPALNQTVNFHAAPYTFAFGVIFGSPSPFLIKAPAEVFVGQRYFVEFRLFQNDNKASFTVRDNVDILV